MSRNATNQLLQKARKSKSDEFYTQYCDIENELQHYTKHFKDKVVYCNCDDPNTSNFFHFFANNFKKLELKKLIASCYKDSCFDLFQFEETENGFYCEYNGETDHDGNPVTAKKNQLQRQWRFQKQGKH